MSYSIGPHAYQSPNYRPHEQNRAEEDEDVQRNKQERSQVWPLAIRSNNRDREQSGQQRQQ